MDVEERGRVVSYEWINQTRVQQFKAALYPSLIGSLVYLTPELADDVNPPQEERRDFCQS
jgi:hypothetical protein